MDLFICNDEGQNKIYENDKSGNLAINTSWIDFSKETEDMAGGNYGSVWTDVNNDGLIDLYVSKCKASATSPEDPRRVNQLFLNEGNGKFYDKAAECFMALGSQSWVTDFGDIDNDGDMDAFVANHYPNSQLMINEDGYFTDYSDSMGVSIGGLITQSNLIDLDNDGLLDIIVAGSGNMIYKNMGNYRFEPVSTINSLNTITSYTIGDINGDGFYDAYCSHPKDFVEPNVYEDEFWTGVPNGNHYLKIGLEGIADNRNGIGSRVFLYGPWGIQMRDIKIGEGYGVTNSSKAHFGLGSHETIDSVKILWPSGQIDLFYNLDIDQTYQITQGNCIRKFRPIEIKGSRQICKGDSTSLVWNDQINPIWNTDEITPEIMVKTSGVYFAKDVAEDGCVTYSENVAIEVDPEQNAQISYSNDTILCEGDPITLSLPGYQELQWSTGSTDELLVVNQSGKYYATGQGLCQFWDSDTVSINYLKPEIAEVEWTKTIEKPKKVIFYGIGDSLLWYERINDLEPAFIGPEWDKKVDSTSTFYVENVNRFLGIKKSIGEASHTGDRFYNNNNFNGQLIFDAFDDLTIVSVDVYTDDPGERTIELKSGNLATQSKSVMLDSGLNTVLLNFNLVPGVNYRLSTDQDKNLAVFGTKNPKLYRTSLDTELAYPYGDEGFIQIKQSNFNNNNYYYFYNWNVKKKDIFCTSDRIPLQVTIDATTTVDKLDLSLIKIFPNPTSGIAEILFDGLNITELELINSNGQIIEKRKDFAQDKLRLDLSKMETGLYILSLKSNSVVYRKKILKF